MNETKLSVGFLTMRTDKHIVVRRTETGARVELGDQFAFHCDMETVRSLCSGLADVLDAYFDERDRRGNA